MSLLAVFEAMDRVKRAAISSIEEEDKGQASAGHEGRTILSFFLFVIMPVCREKGGRLKNSISFGYAEKLIGNINSTTNR